MVKCSVCGRKTTGGYKLCSSCRTYWRNKKRVYAGRSKRKTVTRRKARGFSFWRW